jgi:PIN like domain
MRVLLDEDVPEQAIGALRHLLRGHSVTHVHELGWSGKKDVVLYRDATGRFDAIVTNNHRQLDDPAETAQIKKSGLHHICYGQRVDGLRGLALAIGAIIAAMPAIVAEVSTADGQRLVSIHGLSPARRYDVTDPRRDPPRYWPR